MGMNRGVTLLKGNPMKKIVRAVLLSLALLPFAACAAPSRAAGTTVQDIID